MQKIPFKSALIILAIGIQSLFSGGCASGYTRSVASSANPYKASIEKPVSSVTAELKPEVQEKLKDSLKFDQKVLLEKVELALTNNQILKKDENIGSARLHIVITHVRVRNTFNAVMWGFMSGDDSIEADILVKDAAGVVMDQFHIKTSYALGGLAGGQDSMRMNWLYEAFAKQVVSAITGEPQKG
jgi:hypothetical protein